MLKIGQLAQIKSDSPYVYEALTQIVNGVNAVGRATGVDPSGSIAAPSPIGSLNVIAADGIFDLAITDNSTVQSRHFLFCGVRHDARVQPAVRAFSRQLAQSARGAGQPDALLARLLAISRLGPFRAGHVWHAGDGRRRRRHGQRARAAAVERQRHRVRQRRRIGLRPGRAEQLRAGDFAVGRTASAWQRLSAAIVQQLQL